MVDVITPGNHFVWFGDGGASQFLRINKTFNKDGVEYWYFLLRPSSDIMFKYNIDRDEDVDAERGIIIRGYPRNVIKVLDEDPNHTRILIKTDFNGLPTDLSRENEHKDAEIESLHKSNNALRALIAQKDEEIEMLANDFERWAKRSKRIMDKAGGGGTRGPALPIEHESGFD